MEANDKRRNSRCSTLFLCYYDWTLTKKQLEEERISLAYTSRSQSMIRDAEGRTWGRDQRGILFPALLALLRLSQISNTIQNHLPRDGTAHPGLDPPTPMISQAKAPPTCPQASLMEAISQLQVLSSQGTVVCVHLTKTNQSSQTPLLPAQLFHQR